MTTLTTARPYVEEEPYVEGEPDLRPPEEAAIEELDDETILEQELDNSDIDEDDVDEDVLEASIEELEVHEPRDDASEEDEGDRAGPAVVESPTDSASGDADREAALDDILDSRMGGSAEIFGAAELDPEELDPEDVVVLCHSVDEFVCSSCFLVVHVHLMADAALGRCADCAG